MEKIGYDNYGLSTVQRGDRTMESVEELTITTTEPQYYPDPENIYEEAKVCFLVRNLCNSQSSLLIERDCRLHSDDDDKTMMEAERDLAHSFRRLAEILEGRIMLRNEERSA